MEQADQIMSGEIIFEKIRDGEIISEQTDLRGMIRLEQSGLKASGEKRDRLEQSYNITDREKRRDKIKNKIIVRRLERRVRKVVWIRAEKSV